MLDASEKRRITSIYEERLEKRLPSALAMGWRSSRQQRLRLKGLMQIGDLQGRTLLDVGCGLADLLAMSYGRGLSSYTGVDLSQRVIDQAKTLHARAIAEGWADLKVQDILQEPPDACDYVVASGIFAVRLRDNLGFLKSMLQRMYDSCRIGLAFNLISSYVDYRDEHLAYYSPEETFALCKSLSRRVVLRHDIMPYEFTVYVYRNQNVDRDHIFESYD